MCSLCSLYSTTLIKLRDKLCCYMRLFEKHVLVSRLDLRDNYPKMWENTDFYLMLFYVRTFFYVAKTLLCASKTLLCASKILAYFSNLLYILLYESNNLVNKKLILKERSIGGCYKSQNKWANCPLIFSKEQSFPYMRLAVNHSTYYNATICKNYDTFRNLITN